MSIIVQIKGELSAEGNTSQQYLTSLTLYMKYPENLKLRSMVHMGVLAQVRVRIPIQVFLAWIWACASYFNNLSMVSYGEFCMKRKQKLSRLDRILIYTYNISTTSMVRLGTTASYGGYFKKSILINHSLELIGIGSKIRSSFHREALNFPIITVL